MENVTIWLLLVNELRNVLDKSDEMYSEEESKKIIDVNKPEDEDEDEDKEAETYLHSLPIKIPRILAIISSVAHTLFDMSKLPTTNKCLIDNCIFCLHHLIADIAEKIFHEDRHTLLAFLD